MDENNENQNQNPVMNDNQNVGQQYNNVNYSNDPNMNAQQPYQNMNAQEPINNYQNMNTQQPVNNYQNVNMQQPTNNYQNQATNNPNPNVSQEKAPVLLRILCFFIPLVGLILFAVKYSTEKAYAKSCGIPALIGFILGIVLIPIIFFALFALGIGAAIYDSADTYYDSGYGYSYYYNRYDRQDVFSDLDKEWKL